MRTPTSLPRFTLIALLAGLAAPAVAQKAAPERRPVDEPVVVPQVDRREIRLPRFPSRDFEANVFAGTYSTQNFGASAVVGLRLGYHLNEDFFVEGNLAGTRVSDASFRQILPGGVFPNETESLSYYNLSAGYNLLPGEVFFGRRQARASAFYVLAGVGSTRFHAQTRQTMSVGFGLRMLTSGRAAFRVDVRDHLFSLDLLGQRQSTHNLEVTAGASLHF